MVPGGDQLSSQAVGDEKAREQFFLSAASILQFQLEAMTNIKR